MNSTLKKNVYAGLRRLGLYRFLRWWHRKQAVILTYHGVISNGDDSYLNRNSLSADMFDQQMAYLKRHYHIMALPELVRRLVAREPLPHYALVITFDDGFYNNYAVAAPILRKYDLPATIFLTTAFINSPQLGLWTERVDWLLQTATTAGLEFAMDGEVQHLALQTTRDRIIASDLVRGYLKRLPPKAREEAIAKLAEEIGVVRDLDGSVAERYAFLTWEQVREMQHWRISFGSHTHTHSILSGLSPAEAHFELNESRHLIESELGAPCTIFSYPNGSARDFGRRDIDLLRKLGFVAATSQLPGFNDHKTNLYALRRINISRHRDFNYFLAKISGMHSHVSYKA